MALIGSACSLPASDHARSPSHCLSPSSQIGRVDGSLGLAGDGHDFRYSTGSYQPTAAARTATPRRSPEHRRASLSGLGLDLDMTPAGTSLSWRRGSPEALGSSSPPPKATAGTPGIAQLLEHELSSDRFERREEIAFISKMHEREVSLLKTRVQSATQQLTEERRLYERESASLVSRATSAEERSRRHEYRMHQLEEENARLQVDIQESRSALRRAEVASHECERARDVERRTDRDLARQEQEKLRQVLQRVEHEARCAQQSGRQEELVAQQNAKHLGQQLWGAEQVNWSLKQQESETFVRMRAETLLQAQAEVEQACKSRQWELAHHEVAQRCSELEWHIKAEKQRICDLRASEEVALESLIKISREKLNDEEICLSRHLQQAKADHADFEEELRAQAVKMKNERSALEHSEAKQNAEQDAVIKDLQWQLRESDRRVENARVEQRTLDAEHVRTIQEEREALTVSRLDLRQLRGELDEAKRSAASDRQEVVRQEERERELQEARAIRLSENASNLTARAQELDRNMSREIEANAALKVELAALQDDRAQQQSTVEAYRLEIDKLRDTIAKKEMRCFEAEATEHTKEIAAEQQSALIAMYREQVRHSEQRIDTDAAEARKKHDDVRAQLDECEVAKASLVEAHHKLLDEHRQLSAVSQRQQERVVDLEASTCARLDQIDRDVSEFQRLKEELTVRFTSAMCEDELPVSLNGFRSVPQFANETFPVMSTKSLARQHV